MEMRLNQVELVPTKSLVKRYFLWLLSEWRNHFKPQSLKGIQCPLCGATKQDVRFPTVSATHLGRVRFGTVNQVAPIEDAVDKDISV
jgi:hypothetical protein